MLAWRVAVFLKRAVKVVVAHGCDLDDVHCGRELFKSLDRDSSELAGMGILVAEGLKHLGASRHLEAGK